MAERIDVSIEQRGAPVQNEKPHPNTCPRCDSHYRDDELDAALWVCPHCGHPSEPHTMPAEKKASPEAAGSKPTIPPTA